jgi:hypothetical protein
LSLGVSLAQAHHGLICAQSRCCRQA